MDQLDLTEAIMCKIWARILSLPPLRLEKYRSLTKWWRETKLIEPGVKAQHVTFRV
jgi:hypothetical protein